MINNKSHILNPFLSDEFVHIENIIVLDEPILSHYIRKDNNYFLYLVDKENDIDKYLLFEISDWNLNEYLSGNISLFNLIRRNEDFIHVLDIDFDGNLINNFITDFSNLNQEFLPSEDSYTTFKAVKDSLYYNLILEHNNLNYVNDLKKDAFYIKFSPKTSKYGHTVGFKELSDTILKKISSSYSAFIKSDFTNKFKDKITDISKLTSTLTKVSDETDFRIVAAEIHSFELGLAIDKKMKMSIENKEIRNWAIEVGQDYKQIIINTDFNNQNEIQLIIDNFTEEQRKKIFTPLFEIIENKNISFEVKNNKTDKFRKLKIKDKYTIEKIIPIENKVIEIKNNDLEIIQVTTLVEKGKNLKSLRIDQNTLFSSTDNTNIILKYDDFVNHGYEKVDPNIQIKVNILTNNGLVFFQTIFDNLRFEVNTNNSKLDDGISLIISKLYEYILNKE